MSKKIKGSYLLNAVGVALVFALLTGLFAANAFGTSTTYIQGICTTACYTIIMVTSLNLVVGFMGEFSLGHAGFVSVGAYVSAIVSGALAGKGLSDLGLFLIALLDQCYWILGGCIGALLGQALPVDLTGIDFAMTALFTVILVEQVRRSGNRLPALIGGLSALLMLVLLGPDAFLLPSLLVTVTLLVAGRALTARREADA